MKISPCTMVPSVSVMGFVRPSGLVDVHVSSSLLPTHPHQLTAPKIRFNEFASTMGLRDDNFLSGRSREAVLCDQFDNSLASKPLRTLAGAIFSEAPPVQGRPSVTEEDVLSIATMALLRAREEIRSDELKGHAPADDPWFAGAALFANMQGDPELSLIAMCVLGKKGISSPLPDALAKTRSYYSRLIKGEGESYRSEQSPHWIRI